MRQRNIVLLLFLTTVGCTTNPTPTGNAGTATPGTPNPELTKAAPADPGKVANPEGDQMEAYLKKIDLPGGLTTPGKIKLSAAEHASLTMALKAADTVQPSHLHASVENERLVFSSDHASAQDPGTHLTGKEPEIALAEGAPAKKIVLSEPALKMLQARIVH